tara:strand:+ start:30154 stop:30873 length:720 start_codon:yes stop_codon:yes gene_type:complete
MIPKIIHQTYKTEDIPSRYKKYQERIKTLHSDFEYRFYIDETMDVFMKKEFPDYYGKFNDLPRPIMKIDMFRYFLMYKFGGLYADMDYLFFKKFDLFDNDVVLPCRMKQSKKMRGALLGNCVFASTPNHPFWKSVIDTLFTYNRNISDVVEDEWVSADKKGTGPMFLTCMWKQFNNKDGIITPEQKLFHPEVPGRLAFGVGERGAKRRENHVFERESEYVGMGSYGIHVCYGEWRGGSL